MAPERMSPKATMSELWIPLMDCPTIREDRCIVCGRRYPLNQHHIVRRSSGQHVVGGRVKPKPTITLCGNGNVLASDGRYNCHGLAHHGYLHFRWQDESLWALLLEHPTRYAEALDMDGWTRIWPRRYGNNY